MVTGTNGAIGEALVKALLDRGAAKVYAAAKEGASSSGRRWSLAGKVVPIELGITHRAQVAAAAKRCSDVDVVINNAFVSQESRRMDSPGTEMFWEQVEVNCFGTLGVCLAFAPVLAGRGGGTIANVCSALTLINLPYHDIYRLPLAAGKVRVVRAYPTDCTTAAAGIVSEAAPTPEELAEMVLAGMEGGEPEIPLPWHPQQLTGMDKREGTAVPTSANEAGDRPIRVKCEVAP